MHLIFFRPHSLNPNVFDPFRNFAMIMVKSAVALAITHFSFEVPDGVPKMDDSVPPIGTLKPIGAVRARISARNDRPAEAAVI